MEQFNYHDVDLLEEFERFNEVPLDLLKQLNVYSKNSTLNSLNMEWFEQNFEALKAGFKAKSDMVEDWALGSSGIELPDQFDDEGGL